MRWKSARLAAIRPRIALAVAVMALAGFIRLPADAADTVEFSIPAQPLASALPQVGQQARVQVLFDEALVKGLTAPAVRGRLTPQEALNQLLRGTNLTVAPAGQGTFAVRRVDPSAAQPDIRPAAAARVGVAQAETRPGSEPVDLPGVTVRGLLDQFSYKVDEVLAGTKTKTPALDVPNSVQIIPRQIIDDQGDLRLIDVVRNISGVSVPFSAGGRSERFVIRGFVTEDVFKNFFREDAFSGSRTARELQNIDRVEVVKGPASVLYGRMDPTGAVLLFTKQPLDHWYVNPQMIFGSYDLYRPTLDVTGPLNESRTVLGRFNGVYETSGSFRDFVTTERVFAAPVLSWALRPGTLLTLEGEYLHNDTPIDRGLVAVNRGVANIPISTFLGDPNKRDSAEQGKVSLVLNHAFNETWSLRSAFRWAMASEDYRSIEAQSLQADNRTLNMIASIQPQTFQSYYLQNDLVGTFTTGPIGHQILAGLELGHLTGQQKSSRANAGTMDIFNPTYTFTVGRFTLRQDASSVADEMGLYVQDQVTVLPSLKAVAGLRFDYYTEKSTNKLTSTTERQDDQAFTPRVGFVYQPIAPTSLYFNWSRSFIPQFGTDFDGSQFAPETGEQFEVGAKASFLGGRLLATLALYQITKNNVLTADPLNPGFQIDAGSQRSRGIELDVTGQILPGWNVIAAYAFTDAVITASNDFPVGNTLSNVPRNSGSLWTTYTIQSGPLRGLGFGAGVFAAGRRFGDLNDSFQLPAYVRTDLAVYYTRGPFYAALNAKNVANVTYYEGAQDRTSVIPGAPLTLLGTIGLKF